MAPHTNTTTTTASSSTRINSIIPVPHTDASSAFDCSVVGGCSSCRRVLIGYDTCSNRRRTLLATYTYIQQACTMSPMTRACYRSQPEHIPGTRIYICRSWVHSLALSKRMRSHSHLVAYLCTANVVLRCMPPPWLCSWLWWFRFGPPVFGGLRTFTVGDSLLKSTAGFAVVSVPGLMSCTVGCGRDQ